MRILHLLASPSWSGPAETVALLALEQRRLGHDVTVAVDTLRTQVPSEELSRKRLESLGILDDGGLELCVKSSLFGMRRDVRNLRARALDVVHAHFSHDHTLARWGRPKGAIVVRSIHAPRSLRWVMPRADAFTVPTWALARRLLGRRVHVLPPFVDPAFVPPANKGDLRSTLGFAGSPLVGMVSTFQESRRHGLGVEAFARVLARSPDARLVLVGDGPLEPAIRAHVQRLGLEARVTFAGYQSGGAFVERLQALDEVWILGLGNDWSGRAAAQARACGVPVIAVDEGALSANADALISPDPEAIASASGAPRLGFEPRTNSESTRAVMDLYDRCRTEA